MSMTNEERAKEAARWNPKEPASTGWVDAPEGPPRAAEAEAISLRMPIMLLTILKEFAKRRGIGYQVLIKRWLDERVIEERDKLLKKMAGTKKLDAATNGVANYPTNEGYPMTIELSPQQQQTLQETRRCGTTQEFQELFATAKPEMNRIFLEAETGAQQPNQAIDVTLAELREVYLLTTEYALELKAAYPAERRALLRDAIRLVETAHSWFQENSRTGAYRSRSIEQIIQASRPWRDRLSKIGKAAFVFKPKIAALFEDVNSSNTLDEEKDDLKVLLGYLKNPEYRLKLESKGLSQTHLDQGEQLLQEAEGRDLLAVLGIKSGQEAIELRNSLLTYSIFLGQEARAEAINAFSNEPLASNRFEAKNFRNAIRRVKSKRRAGTNEEDETEATADPSSPDAQPA